MKNFTTQYLFTSVFLLFSFMNLHAQSPWVKEHKEGFTQLGFSMIGPYTSLINGPSLRATDRKVTDVTIQSYTEYGLSSKITAILWIPFKYVKTGDLIDTNLVPKSFAGKLAGFGNPQVAIRYQLYNKKFAMALQGKIEFPAAKDRPDSLFLRKGYSALSFEPTLSIGKGLKHFYGYAFGGFVIRTNNYSSGWTVGAEIGAGGKGNYVSLFVSVLQSFYNGTRNDKVWTGLYVNNQQYGAMGIKLLGSFLKEKCGATLSAGFAFSGNNVAATPSINAGLFYRWKGKPLPAPVNNPGGATPK